MKNSEDVYGYIISLRLGFIITPLLSYARTNMTGMINGPAYDLPEGELIFYPIFEY